HGSTDSTGSLAPDTSIGSTSQRQDRAQGEKEYAARQECEERASIHTVHTTRAAGCRRGARSDGTTIRETRNAKTRRSPSASAREGSGGPDRVSRPEAAQAKLRAACRSSRTVANASSTLNRVNNGRSRTLLHRRHRAFGYAGRTCRKGTRRNDF